jgi:hypothetical protein
VTGKEVRERYEKFEKWLQVYHTLNSTGVFDGPFTDRLEISMRVQGNVKSTEKEGDSTVKEGAAQGETK